MKKTKKLFKDEKKKRALKNNQTEVLKLNSQTYNLLNHRSTLSKQAQYLTNLILKDKIKFIQKKRGNTKLIHW